MITTYSYLDQYKQIEFSGISDYFMQFVETPFPLTITLLDSIEYGITLSEQPVEYIITLSETAGG